jgi:hypothetical protein
MGEAGSRILDYDGTFFLGVDSSNDPSQCRIGACWTALNMINLGGQLSCRPGHRCIVQLPDGNLQGAAVFKPQEGLEQMVVAVDGQVYVALWPFNQFHLLTNVLFSPTAKQIFWALTTQAAERLNEDFSSGIKVIPPKSVLIMQDGGFTAPAWYDGSNSGHIRDHAFDTPAGGPMVWVGNRLWVSVNNSVQASDIANPFSFREQIYLGGQSAFYFASEVTGMVKTPSVESPQLLVFTEANASILQANIQDRSQWPTTTNFQEEILQVGCLSNRSIKSHYGQVIWFSPSGVAVFDPATSGKLTSRLPVRDNEMMFSKVTLSDDLSLVAAGTFGQFFVMSVPAEDTFNKHTWVLNNASLATLTDASGPSWAGHWTGTRPVEWVCGEIMDAERAFHVSADTDGHNRLWESFRPDRLDNGCPITWAFTTRAHFGQTAPVQAKLPGSTCRLQWVDVALVGIAEDVDLGVFYAGGTRGAFQQVMSRRISVEKGSLSWDLEMDSNTTIFAFKPQSRTVRTEDANQKTDNDSLSACGIERADIDNIDDCFQYLIVGHGPATVKYVRSFALTTPEDKSGASTACEDETGLNAVRYDGAAVKGTDRAEVTAALADVQEQHFTSNQTELVIQDGFSAVGTGFAESIVNQGAADRVAKIIATKQAEAELAGVVPPTISAGIDT